MFERRQRARYVLPAHKSVSIVEINGAQELFGRIIDVSDGGLKMALEGQVQPGQVLKCELAVPELPVRIPSLVQARWSSGQSREHVCGLRFVI
jgi:c-di-GMP-binding flagellar brake protein YcgR